MFSNRYTLDMFNLFMTVLPNHDAKMKSKSEHITYHSHDPACCLSHICTQPIEQTEVVGQFHYASIQGVKFTLLHSVSHIWPAGMKSCCSFRPAMASIRPAYFEGSKPEQFFSKIAHRSCLLLLVHTDLNYVRFLFFFNQLFHDLFKMTVT